MTPPTTTPNAERPSNVRYTVLGLLCSLTFLLYLDRVCLGQAAVKIQNDLGFDDDWMGWVHAAFQLSYLLFELPTGHWGDRYGSRKIVVRIVLWWSVFTALTGAVWSLPLLIGVRFLFGAGEAGALPNAARIIPTWFPESFKSTALGWVTFSMLLGGVVAPAGAQFLIVRVGWRWTFAVFGAVGVVWALVFGWWFRDSPADHPWVNGAERRLIARGGTHAVGEHPPIPWGTIFRSPNFWLMSWVISCGAFTAYLYFQWLSAYLEKGVGVTDDRAGVLASLVLFGGAVGSLAGGVLGPGVLRLTGNRRLTRRLTGSIGFFGASGCMVLGLRSEDPLALCGWFSLSFLLHYIQLTTWWTAATELSGRHVGALVGLMNSISIAAGALSSVLFGSVAKHLRDIGYTGRDCYDPVLYLCVGVYFAGAVGWLFINADRPMVPPEAAAKESDASQPADPTAPPPE